MFDKKSIKQRSTDNTAYNSNRIKTKINNNKYLLVLSLIFIIIGCCFLNKNIVNLFDLISIFKQGTHLILVQNNAELRPTGGFIGSIATIRTRCYLPRDFYYDTNIYKRDNEFTYKQKIIPTDSVLAKFIPESGLALRDSNWTIDFPKAATEIAWFYEQEKGSKVDSVITIDTEFFKKILHIIGPIKMVKYNITVDENNFNEVIQNQVENAYYEDEDNYSIHEPKSILADMYPIVLARVKNPKYFGALIATVFDSLAQKNILLYSYNTKNEHKILKNNWGGQVKNTQGDYLYINNANLGSNKTSLDVQEDIQYQTDCSDEQCTATLQITRKNNNTTQTNKNFTAILTPKNSKLIQSTIDDKDAIKNIEIQEKYEKNLFRLWTSVEPNQTTNIKITYNLPQSINKKNYKLLIQKQPGAINQKLTVLSTGDTEFDSDFSTDLSF